jgi:hypothetical protein
MSYFKNFIAISAFMMAPFYEACAMRVLVKDNHYATQSAITVYNIEEHHEEAQPSQPTVGAQSPTPKRKIKRKKKKKAIRRVPKHKKRKKINKRPSRKVKKEWKRKGRKAVNKRNKKRKYKKKDK